jgi:hypothetical protein
MKASSGKTALELPENSAGGTGSFGIHNEDSSGFAESAGGSLPSRVKPLLWGNIGAEALAEAGRGSLNAVDEYWPQQDIGGDEDAWQQFFLEARRRPVDAVGQLLKNLQGGIYEPPCIGAGSNGGRSVQNSSGRGFQETTPHGAGSSRADEMSDCSVFNLRPSHGNGSMPVVPAVVRDTWDDELIASLGSPSRRGGASNTAAGAGSINIWPQSAMRMEPACSNQDLRLAGNREAGVVAAKLAAAAALQATSTGHFGRRDQRGTQAVRPSLPRASQ